MSAKDFERDDGPAYRPQSKADPQKGARGLARINLHCDFTAASAIRVASSTHCEYILADG